MEEQDDFRKVSFTTRFDPYKGRLEMNLLEILNDLDDEAKQLIISDGGWWNIISEQMARDIVDKFSRDSYNPEYTNLRKIILNSEGMSGVIREWAVAMAESREHAQEAESYWSVAYWSLYHWVRETICRGDSHDMPKLPDRVYGKKYSQELMKEVELKIQEWQKEFPEIAIDVTD